MFRNVTLKPFASVTRVSPASLSMDGIVEVSVAKQRVGGNLHGFSGARRSTNGISTSRNGKTQSAKAISQAEFGANRPKVIRASDVSRQSRSNGNLSPRKRVHQPADSDRDNKKGQKCPGGILEAFDRSTLREECKRDRNHEGEEGHGAEMRQVGE